MMYQSVFEPILPESTAKTTYWGRTYGSAGSLLVAEAVKKHNGLVVVLCKDAHTAQVMQQEAAFYLAGTEITVLNFPDWETLPYDVFSPHQDIISERLTTLYTLSDIDKGLLILPVTTLMSRIAPPGFVQQNSLIIKAQDTIDITEFREKLLHNGYQHVSQVMEHGDFTVRGSIIDLYPMGSATPYRLDLFDDEIESIRCFDPESQRSTTKVEQINMLPAHEFPLTEEAIQYFRQQYRIHLEGNPQQSQIYQDVSQGRSPQGIEYFLPLFFDETASLFDFFSESTLLIRLDDVADGLDDYWETIAQRYENYRHDIERPVLPPEKVFFSPEQVNARSKTFLRVSASHFEQDKKYAINYATSAALPLNINARAENPAATLQQHLSSFQGNVLFVAETAGRREVLLELFAQYNISPQQVDSWQALIDSDNHVSITTGALTQGLTLDSPAVCVITENQLFGEQTRTTRTRTSKQNTDTIVRNLTELNIGSPVVHEEHGVGRYLGLQSLNVGHVESEYLTLEYSGGDKLYVPVSSLHMISRYTGTSPENAPLHRLGSEQWARARRKATEKAYDVAAELLDVYSRRAARKGIAYPPPDEQYQAFVSTFPFAETPDQAEAIQDVINDMVSDQPMDRLVCGDVGFGKTEVAMRAAFLAVQGGKQVVVLVPTTLLTQQHYENFKDRFADWPVKIESISRFKTKGEAGDVIQGVRSGKIDIVIGTHSLLGNDVQFKQLGLVIIDEEHRFGVRQKEKLKKLRSDVDILTLTATPIPRTLNMALSQIRDLSIIATPPTNRLSIKTFVREWNDSLLKEAIYRELNRGGQIYFLHNEVKNIEKTADQLRALVPDARIEIAHGQMRERDLERVMLDFYHQRFNVLVCTTIIETGIDVPSANTIIMNRADRFGLAQLYQLRGRVGRSHHRAYAYLVVPPRKAMTSDAIKRLEAIESLEELGTGFMLATHDLEIRGAGELLGDEQSGQMFEVGFSLYTELLERAVNALKSGKQPELNAPLQTGTEVDFHMPALIPDDYLPDVHGRLIMYKRIANAETDAELRDLQVEMIDRFGLLPDPVKTLFEVTRVKLLATAVGIKKLEVSEQSGRILFTENPDIEPMAIISLIQTYPDQYKFDGKEVLRFNGEMDDLKSRIDVITNLLNTLSNKHAA